MNEAGRCCFFSSTRVAIVKGESLSHNLQVRSGGAYATAHRSQEVLYVEKYQAEDSLSQMVHMACEANREAPIRKVFYAKRSASESFRFAPSILASHLSLWIRIPSYPPYTETLCSQ